MVRIPWRHLGFVSLRLFMLVILGFGPLLGLGLLLFSGLGVVWLCSLLSVFSIAIFLLLTSSVLASSSLTCWIRLSLLSSAFRTASSWDLVTLPSGKLLVLADCSLALLAGLLTMGGRDLWDDWDGELVLGALYFVLGVLAMLLSLVTRLLPYSRGPEEVILSSVAATLVSWE